MKTIKFIHTSLGFLLFFTSIKDSIAQHAEQRIQYPKSLKNAYFGVSFGYINYPFSNAHLENNFSAAVIDVPHKALRIILYGRQLTKHVSAQISYMRPTAFARYHNVNGEGLTHNVWMTVGGLTLKADIPIYKKFFLEAEGGLGVITRRGFHVNNVPAIKNTSYANFLFGSALSYRLSSKWDLRLNMAWTPAHTKARQPQTIFFGAGFNYHLKPLTAERVERNIKAGLNFPKQIIYAGITSNVLGYGVNNAVSKGPIVIFWGGEAHVKSGFSINYQRNIFRARKVFGFDWGSSMGIYTSRDKADQFFTFSLFPVMRFMAMRSKALDLAFEYAVAGPTYISKAIIDNKQTGKNFTFYDFMGMQVFAGKQKNIHAGLRIAHFSNGNMHPNNEGVKVPLTLNLGYVMN